MFLFREPRFNRVQLQTRNLFSAAEALLGILHQECLGIPKESLRNPKVGETVVDSSIHEGAKYEGNDTFCPNCTRGRERIEPQTTHAALIPQNVGIHAPQWSKKGMMIRTLGMPRDSKKRNDRDPRNFKKGLKGTLGIPRVPRDSKKGIIGTLGIPVDSKKG